MDTITPHLWFDRDAIEAAEFYAATFPDSKVIGVTTIPQTPGGDTDIVTFRLCGQSFQAINAGPLFSFNPSVSFAVSCDTIEEVDRLWAILADGGTTLMPLGTYPFSERYGWTQDTASDQCPIESGSEPPGSAWARLAASVRPPPSERVAVFVGARHGGQADDRAAPWGL